MTVQSALLTPIYLKTDEDMPWPEGEDMFYVLAGNGLFLCRNHEFFRSSVPARRWPSELLTHRAHVQVAYPKIPQEIFETVVGFFDEIRQRHGSEAGVLLAWDRVNRCMELVVPQQTATVNRSAWTGRVYPIGLHYETPELPPNWLVIGDIHSHVDEPAYASATDKYDETHRAGLHLVVGRLSSEPPELHIEVVVDGTRFEVERDAVLSGYESRRTDFPPEWLDRVTVDPPSKPVTYGEWYV